MARPRVVPFVVCALVTLLLAAAATPTAEAQEGASGPPSGTVDLVLRPPPQTMFRVGEDGRPYGSTLVEADAGAAIVASPQVRVFRGSNQLSANVSWEVEWWLVLGSGRSFADGASERLLASTNGSIGPDAPGRTSILLNATMPLDAPEDTHAFEFRLKTGDYDPEPSNNDPSPIAVRVGPPQVTLRSTPEGWKAWSGPALAAVLVVLPAVWARRRSRRALVGRTTGDDLGQPAAPDGSTSSHTSAAAAAFGDARLRVAERYGVWLQRPANERKRRLQALVVVLLMLLGGLLLAANGTLGAGAVGLLDAALMAMLAAALSATGAAWRHQRARRHQDPDASPMVSTDAGPGVDAAGRREPSAARGASMRGDAARAAALDALGAAAVVFALAFFWQQLSGATGLVRWASVFDLAPFLVIGLVIGAVYALIAIGYTMVYGVLKFINFAHGEIFMWGGYFAWLFVVFWPVLPLWAALLVAVVLAALMGAVIERVAYRPLRGASRLTPLITAIAMSLLLASLAQFVFGARSVGFEMPGSTFGGTALEAWLDRRHEVFGTIVDRLALVTAVLSGLLMYGLHAFVRRTRAGRAIRAVADDLETAEIIGIDVDRAITWTFMIGSGLAAVGGVLYGLRFSLSPTTGLLIGLKAFTAAVVGGIGNIYGAFVGGLVIGLAENVGGQFIDTRFQKVITFAVLMGFLLFRPRGIFRENEGVERR